MNKKDREIRNNASSSKKIINVLLVDDGPLFAHLVEHQLKHYESWNLKVTWFSRAEDAIAHLKETVIVDIIVTDYIMPGLSGIDFCLQLDEMGYQVPIIFFSSNDDIQIAIEAMKLGVEEVIYKRELEHKSLPRIITSVYEASRMRSISKMVEKRIMLSEKRSQAIKEVVVTVCHEFNNPLAAIKICVDLLSRQKLEGHGNERMNEFEKNFTIVQDVIEELRNLNFEDVNYEKISK